MLKMKKSTTWKQQQEQKKNKKRKHASGENDSIVWKTGIPFETVQRNEENE